MASVLPGPDKQSGLKSNWEISHVFLAIRVSLTASGYRFMPDRKGQLKLGGFSIHGAIAT
jgi:hypothetical protein